MGLAPLGSIAPMTAVCDAAADCGSSHNPTTMLIPQGQRTDHRQSGATTSPRQGGGRRNRTSEGEPRTADRCPQLSGVTRQTVTPPRLRESLDDLDALLGQAAGALNRPYAFLEKDFWALEGSARRGTRSPHRSARRHNGDSQDYLQGGTSLSRVYGLIDRFSEDIDLLVIFPDEGGGSSETNVTSFSRASRLRFTSTSAPTTFARSFCGQPKA